MSRKIITFLSDYREPGEENTYKTTDSEIKEVRGNLTNDAPIAFFMEKYKGSIDSVICIVTEKAKKTFERLKDNHPNNRFVQIDYNIENEKFEGTPLSRLLEEFNFQQNHTTDTILLDITGGTRDVPLKLLLVSRLLSYASINTEQIIYGNYNNKTVEDITENLQLFDLIEGMHAFVNFGKTNDLKKYYQRQSEIQGAYDETINEMIKSLDALSEAVTLCRTQQLEEKYKEFNDSYKNVNTKDPMTRPLINQFKGKFGNGKQITVPGLIKWYLKNDMIQAALTIYRERIPLYILQQEHLVQYTGKKEITAELFAVDLLQCYSLSFLKNLTVNSQEDEIPEKIRPVFRRISSIARNYETQIQNNMNEYETIYTELNEKGIRRDRQTAFNYLRNNIAKYSELTKGTCFSECLSAKVYTIKEFDDDIKQYIDFNILCTNEKLQEIMMDFQYIYMLRNLTNHAAEIDDRDKGLYSYLTEKGYPPIETVGVEKIKDIVTEALERLKKGKN